MDELIKTFHIDWKLLIAQMVNFSIVIGVLGFYAMKPLTKIMTEREDRVKKSLKDAESIEKTMKDIEKQREDEIKKGRQEAQRIIAQTEKDAEELRISKLAKTQKEVEKVIEQARNQIRAEREIMVKDVKDELAGLLSLALNRVASNTIDEKVHKKLIDKTIDELNQTTMTK